MRGPNRLFAGAHVGAPSSRRGRRLAGLLVASLLALLWLSMSAAPAAAECSARPGAGGATVFVCDASDVVVFSVNGGALRHNRASDFGFDDEFDFDNRGSAPGSQRLSNLPSTQVQIFNSTGDNDVTIGDVTSPASFIVVSFTLMDTLGGNDRLTIDDTANTTTARTITVTANEVTGPDGVVSYGGSGVETLSIKAGGGGDQINVLSTAVGTTTIIEGGGGDDTFNVGNNGTLDLILGPLTVAGFVLNSGTGTDRLTLSDSAETADTTYTLTLTTLRRTGAATITYDFTSVLSLTTGSGNDTLTVDELPFSGNFAFDLGAGNDRIVWDTVTNILPRVIVEAGPGANTFQFNAPTIGTQFTTVNCTGQLTVLTTGQDCNATSGRISIGTIGQAVFNGSAVRDTIQVTALPGMSLTVNGLAGDDFLAVMGAGAGSTVAINAGEGNDAVNVGSPISAGPTTSALAIQAPVTVDGGSGTNRLAIARGNTSPAPVPPGGSATVTITPTQVGAATGDTYFGSGGSLTYTGFDTLLLNGYDVDDTVLVTPSTTTEYTVQGLLQTTADTLDVDVTGTTGAFLDLEANPNEIRFADRRTVKFTGFETKKANGQPIAGLIGFGAAAFDAAESAGPATVTVTRSSVLGAASVQLTTSDGTATGGVDFTPATVTVQFAPGETSKTVTIPILRDAADEGEETATLTLSSAVGLVGEAALGSQTTATLRIRDIGCGSPRPTVGVSVAPIGNGQLRATVRAQRLPTTQTNELRGLRIAKLANARLSLNGQPLQDGQATPLPAGTQEVALVVERAAPGQPGTAQLVVTDFCGDWPTFVGGGANGFGP